MCLKNGLLRVALLLLLAVEFLSVVMGSGAEEFKLLLLNLGGLLLFCELAGESIFHFTDVLLLLI
jgi:hypothetical protein